MAFESRSANWHGQQSENLHDRLASFIMGNQNAAQEV
jgi:hypothetical protein